MRALTAFLAESGGNGINQYTPARGFGHGQSPRKDPHRQYHEGDAATPNPVFGIQQVRGKKTKSSVRFEDLPQGPIIVAKSTKTTAAVAPSSSSSSSPGTAPEPGLEGEGEGEEEKEPAYPTVVLQARRNMRKFDNCVLLTRVGGFYELYFEHAEEYGPLLNLKVAQKKTNAGPVPMVRSLFYFVLFTFMSIEHFSFAKCYCVSTTIVTLFFT